MWGFFGFLIHMFATMVESGCLIPESIHKSHEPNLFHVLSNNFLKFYFVLLGKEIVHIIKKLNQTKVILKYYSDRLRLYLK